MGCFGNLAQCLRGKRIASKSTPGPYVLNTPNATCKKVLQEEDNTPSAPPSLKEPTSACTVEQHSTHMTGMPHMPHMLVPVCLVSNAEHKVQSEQQEQGKKSKALVHQEPLPLEAPLDSYMCLQALTVVIHVEGRRCWPLPLCCRLLHHTLPPLTQAHCSHLRAPLAQAHLARLTQLNTLVLEQQLGAFCVIDTPGLISVLHVLTQLQHLRLRCDTITAPVLGEALSQLTKLTLLKLGASNIPRPPLCVIKSRKKWKQLLEDKLSLGKAEGSDPDTWQEAVKRALLCLTNLRHLDLAACKSIRFLCADSVWEEVLPSLTQLTHLSMSQLPIGFQAWLPRLPKLVELSFTLDPFHWNSADWNASDRWLEPNHLSGLTQLTSLNVTTVGDHMTNSVVVWLTCLTNLRKLECWPAFRSVSLLSPLTRLTYLHGVQWAGNCNVSSCHLALLSALRHLCIRFSEQCDAVAQVLTQLSLLTHLTLQHCSRFALPAQSATMSALAQSAAMPAPFLSVAASALVESASTTNEWEWFPHLQALHLEHCNLEDCSSLISHHLTCLSVSFPYHWSNTCCHALQRACHLRELDLFDCPELNDTLETLTTLTSLQKLACKHYEPSVVDFRLFPLGELTNLTCLDFAVFHALSHTASLSLLCLSRLTHLQHLGLQIHVKMGAALHADWLLPKLLPHLTQLKTLELGEHMLTLACERALTSLKNLELCKIWTERHSHLRAQAVAALMALPSAPGVLAGRLGADDFYFLE